MLPPTESSPTQHESDTSRSLARSLPRPVSPRPCPFEHIVDRSQDSDQFSWRRAIGRVGSEVEECDLPLLIDDNVG
jgi:hypothetical protein